MKETRKQKEIRLRRRAIHSAYIVTDLSTTDFVDSMAKKLKLSSVTVYADLKTRKLEIAVEEYINQMGYTWTFKSVMAEYIKSIKGEYVSHTAKDVINRIIKPNI